MSCRNVVQELTQYQRARLKFCQVIGECASRPQNIPYMENEGVIELLQPLLTDPEMAIRSNSVCCLSRMANHSARVATELIERRIPETMLRELIVERNNNLHYRRAVLQALKAISKHSEETAAQIVECGGLSACLVCMEEQDVLLKEAACCGIGCIVRSSAHLAMKAVEQGAATLLVLCLQMNELNIKQVATLALGDIARHSPAHAKKIVDAGAVGSLVRMVDQTDSKLKRQSLNALASIASTSSELANLVTQSDVFPKILIHLGHESIFVQRQAARLVLEITKHSLELAQTIVNAGGIGPLVQCLMNGPSMEEDIITPAAMALGYIAGQSPHFALAVIESKAIVAFSGVVDSAAKRTPVQLAACVWAIGQIGRHSSEHSKAVSDSALLAKVLQIYDNAAQMPPSAGGDLRVKCKTMLQSCIQCCLDVAAIEPLIYNAPPEILEMILRQFGKILPKDAALRRLFQTVGGLKKIQDLRANVSENLAKLIDQINACYSEEVIKYYSGSGAGGSNNNGGSNGPTTRAAVPSLIMLNNNSEAERISTCQSIKKPQDFFISDGEAAISTGRSADSAQSKRCK